MKNMFSEMLEDVMEVVEIFTPESISELIDEWILEARMKEANKKLSDALYNLMMFNDTDEVSDIIDNYILSLR